MNSLTLPTIYQSLYATQGDDMLDKNQKYPIFCLSPLANDWRRRCQLINDTRPV